MRLLAEGHEVTGFDNLCDYYDPALKHARQDILLRQDGFKTVTNALENPSALKDVFAEFRPDYVIHLAAQAGVRYSIERAAILRHIEPCRHIRTS